MTYIIAEIGSTHDGSIGNALRMIEVFAGLGADCIKFQCHAGQGLDPEQLHPSPNVHELRGRYYQRIDWGTNRWVYVKHMCRALEVDFMVSPFSVPAVQLLNESPPPDSWKIASGEVTNIPLLEAVKATGKDVYLSSGMTTGDELSVAANALESPHSKLYVLHCTSEYPCAPERVGLNMLWSLREQYPWAASVGLSDHTLGLAASLAAITLGATVIERHVTLSRRMYGSDAAHSLEPDEFAQFVREVRELDRMLASPVDKDALVQTPEIQKMREVFLCKSEPR